MRAIVYSELKRLAVARLAHEAAAHTLDATAPVHEAYLRSGKASFADRSGFFRGAAMAMQLILVDHARRKRAAKRGGLDRRRSLDDSDRPAIDNPDTVLDVDEALGRVAEEGPSSAGVARLRLFDGLSISEAAEATGVSRASAYRGWAYARARLTYAVNARRCEG